MDKKIEMYLMLAEDILLGNIFDEIDDISIKKLKLALLLAEMCLGKEV